MTAAIATALAAAALAASLFSYGLAASFRRELRRHRDDRLSRKDPRDHA